MKDIVQTEPARNPKVSVCVVTYNQEKYIGRCLESVVNQDTDFDFEVIVGDDCSTDNTRKILQEFSEKHPKLIRLLLHDKNVGPFQNYRRVHGMAIGDYVAHLDGDDSALPGKLYKQNLYLDTHVKCALVAHRMSVWDGHHQVYLTKPNQDPITLTQLLSEHPMFLNSSIMYRRKIIGNIFHVDTDFIDFYIYVHAALRSDLGFLNEVLGCYTRHIGISSTRDLMLYVQSAIDQAVDAVPNQIINRARSKQYLSYATAALMVRDEPRFVKYITAARNCNKNSLLTYAFCVLRNQIRLIRFFVFAYKSLKLMALRFELFLAPRSYD